MDSLTVLRFALRTRGWAHGVACRHHARVTTTSRYSLGTTSDPGPARFRPSSRSASSPARASALSGDLRRERLVHPVRSASSTTLRRSAPSRQRHCPEIDEDTVPQRQQIDAPAGRQCRVQPTAVAVAGGSTLVDANLLYRYPDRPAVAALRIGQADRQLFLYR